MTGETQAFLDFDILEVNGYLMSGLMGSQIDRWFTGSAPQFNPGDLFTSQTPKTLDEALQSAHAALQDASQTAWQPVGCLFVWILTLRMKWIDCFRPSCAWSFHI